MTPHATEARAECREPLFDQIIWRDPLSGRRMTPRVAARTPAGVPIHGALQVDGTRFGYPIVDCVARLTPELADRHADWLRPFDLDPPRVDGGEGRGFQEEATVDSFGFQWSWNSAMRSDADLRWRVATRFQLDPASFAARMVLDAGAGAGDQSVWLIRQGASVISIDLSSSIDVVARKLRMEPGWFGVQGDITVLPFGPEQFDLVYCEGVIQHTRDSAATVRELCRMLPVGGSILATHYGRSRRWTRRVQIACLGALRKRLSRVERYKLLLVAGNLAALAYVPLLGRLVRLSGLATHYDLMPDFRTTWTNTFDHYGNHAFQRRVTPEEFWSYFQAAGEFEPVFREETLVHSRRRA